MFHKGGTHGVIYTLHYFYFDSYFVHYTSSYTGRVAVVAMLLPLRVDASCSDSYLLYLRILCTACSISY